MEGCPVCRSRLRGATVCRRCGTDLALSLSIADRAEQALKLALYCMAQGNLQEAQAAAEQAQTLRRTPLAPALSGFLDYLAKRKSAFTELPRESNEHAPQGVEYSQSGTNH